MTTQPHFPRNKAIVFGIVDTRQQRERDRKKGGAPEAAVRRFRNPALGETYTVKLQVASPYGNTFALAVEVNAGIAGAEHLPTARPGDVLVLEGHLVRTEEVDDRFANFGEEEPIDGIHYRDVAFKVSSLRPRAEQDPASTGSSVWVEGEVIEPPAILRHPQRSEILFARMRLRVKTALRTCENPLFPAVEQTCEMTVIIPVENEGAGYLYRRGNRVRLRGVLERMPLRQAGVEVRDRLDELDAAWRTKQAEILDDARALRAEGMRYLRERERLERSPRTMVLVAEVQPLEGAELIDLETARRDRDAYTSAQRQARAARIERGNGRRMAQQAERPAPDAEVAPAGEVAPEPERVRPPRRRRPVVTPQGGEADPAAAMGVSPEAAPGEEAVIAPDVAEAAPGDQATVMPDAGDAVRGADATEADGAIAAAEGELGVFSAEPGAPEVIGQAEGEAHGAAE